MKKVLTLFLLMTLNFNLYACPELDGEDLANGDGPWLYEELESFEYKLSKDDFESLPVFSEMEFEECEEALYVQKVKSKTTGRVFSALMSNEDNCDGGNSYGLLYDNELKQILGTIGDSFISCY